MGKASQWLRNLFLPGRKGRKPKDRADADCQSVLSAPLPSHAQAATPPGREKRRWSFRRPGAAASSSQGPLASSSSHCFSEAELHVVVVLEQDQQQAAAAAVPEVASTAGTVVALPASGRRRMSARGGGPDGEAAAAVKIQSAFRSYLARKALCALRGMVKLQAMVRGQLVRRQACLTLRRMQALVYAQRRARAERLRLLDVVEDDASRQQTAAAATPPSRRSPQHPRSWKPLEAVERGLEENVRIVEVDYGAPRAGARRNSCGHCSASTTPSRTPAAKAEPRQKVSPSPSALTEASARTPSGRFDDASFTSTLEPMPSRRAAPPSYMANTESSRAKVRSQSAPRQRLSSAPETALAATASAVPSPSCCDRPPSQDGGSARRRASLDPLDLPGGVPSRRMERCASRARATTMSSVPGSECGSSSTVGHRGSAHGP